jgi:two-component system chemotaxis sensor kinase CheA
MLRTGNDPLLMIRELHALGELAVQTDRSRLPGLAEMDAGQAYLAWTFQLTTDKGRDAIDEVFEFVAGDTADITVDEVGQAPADEEGDGWGLFAPPPPPAPVPAAAPPAEAPHPHAATPAAPHAAPAPGGGAGGVHTASIRVDLDRIDRLVNMVGELVITQAMLGQQASHFSVESHPELIQGLQELSHHTRELQESVMAIRAQPVKALFSRAPRLVRDLSAKLGKQARLVMSGENTEVDKTVIEQLSDPLTHLIRNSLDHGIEGPDERLAKGKPAEGTIHLGAEHRSGRIIIEVSDDGAGINRRRVYDKAVDKGLVERGAALTDEQIDQLIFAPGFSTAEQVSDVSGRGVGMDVVRKNIQDVGGRVVVQSTPGEGSRFILSLPLTLAVMDGMLVSVGGQRYVLPLTNIVESLRPNAQQARSLVDVGDVLTIRGEYIPLVRLYQLFGVRNALTDPTRGLVVVVETEGGDRIGVLVDELLGQQQVVIKSLDSNYRPVEGISAATILGDGRVALILDVGALRAIGERRRRPATPVAPELAAE